jgi:hypothetical protein
VLLCVTGASGAGKSTVLDALVRALVSQPVTCAEFDSVGVPPEIVRSTGADGTIWRQNTIEQWTQRAVDEQRAGRHLLLCGQMPAGEILAAPSAELLDGIAACLLHCSPEVRRKRLIDRGEDPEMLEAHVAFGEWFLGHLTNPAHMPEVIVVRGATRMRWDRWQHWTAGDQRWRFEVINTDSLTHRQTAEAVLAWVTDVLAVRRPSLSGRWWQR